MKLFIIFLLMFITLELASIHEQLNQIIDIMKTEQSRGE